MTSTEIESIEDLDFEFEPPCEMRGPDNCGGSNPAVWKIHLHPCCEYNKSIGVVLFCDPCLWVKLHREALCCKACGMFYVPAGEAYLKIERL